MRKKTPKGCTICTQKKPMPANTKGGWCHPDATAYHYEVIYQDRKLVAETIHFRCPHCGHEFKTVLDMQEVEIWINERDARRSNG